MVAPWKEQFVNEIAELASKNRVVGVVELKELPAPQLHELRKKFRKIMVLKGGRKKLLWLGLEKAGRSHLKEHFGEITALLFSNEDPFELFAKIEKEKAPAPAKAGVIAPEDIVIPAGPTDFPPMAMAMFKQLKIKVKVEGGKIKVLEDTVVTKAGEEIKPEVAELVNKLGIKPLKVGLKILALSDGERVYTRDVLEMAIKDYSPEISDAFKRAFLLAVGIGLPTKETMPVSIRNAWRDAMALAIGAVLPVKEALVERMKEAYRVAEKLNSLISS